MKYDLSKLMKKAWTLYRKLQLTFSECLHRAWISAKAAPVNEGRIAEAKAAAGITEETATWSDWKKAGYEVHHGSKALFQVSLIFFMLPYPILKRVLLKEVKQKQLKLL